MSVCDYVTRGLCDNGSDGCFLCQTNWWLIFKEQVHILRLNDPKWMTSEALKTAAVQGLIVMDWNGQTPVKLPERYRGA